MKTNTSSTGKLAVKSHVRAGALTDNHNRQLVVKSGVRAGSLTANHNLTIIWAGWSNHNRAVLVGG